MKRRLEVAREFDHRLALCDGDESLNVEVCPFKVSREKTETRLKLPKDDFNGLMIVGEGPGHTEARLGEPFVGPAGKLLNRLLESAHIERSECVLSNATLCVPPSYGKDVDKAKALEEAVPLCRTRLLNEIHEIKPRVILALGTPALRSVCGSLIDKVIRIPFTCDFCGGARYVHWERCSKVSKCKDPETGKPTAFYIPPGQNPEGGYCPNCGDGELTVQPKRKMCPDCGGRKTFPKEIKHLHSDYTITKVAGAVFRGEDLPHLPEETKYVIPTFHPSFLLRGNDDDKGGGQFLVPAVDNHLRKVRRLLTEADRWKLRWRVTNEPQDLVDYVTEYRYRAPYFSCDIETDAKNPWDVTDIQCVGIHAAGVDAPALVLDTRGLTKGHKLVEALWDSFLSDPKIRKVGQNFSYDISVLELMWG